MKLLRGSLQGFESTSFAGPVLNAVIVYEDTDTGLRAKRCLDLLPANFRMEPQITIRLYRVDLLQPSLLREQAAIEAAAADVVIVSLHGGTELNPVVGKWMERWLQLKEERPYALGLLLDPMAARKGSSDPVIRHVQCLFHSTDVEIFYGFYEGTMVADLARRSAAGAEVEGRAVRPTEPDRQGTRGQAGWDVNQYRHWGINE